MAKDKEAPLAAAGTAAEAPRQDSYRLTKAQADKALTAAQKEDWSGDVDRKAYKSLANKLGEHVSTGYPDRPILFTEPELAILTDRYGVNVKEG